MLHVPLQILFLSHCQVPTGEAMANLGLRSVRELPYLQPLGRRHTKRPSKPSVPHVTAVVVRRASQGHSCCCIHAACLAEVLFIWSGGECRWCLRYVQPREALKSQTSWICLTEVSSQSPIIRCWPKQGEHWALLSQYEKCHRVQVHLHPQEDAVESSLWTNKALSSGAPGQGYWAFQEHFVSVCVSRNSSLWCTGWNCAGTHGSSLHFFLLLHGKSSCCLHISAWIWFAALGIFCSGFRLCLCL